MTESTCSICGDNFSTHASLQQHCWDAHGSCHHCDAGFEDRDSLYVHWLAAHDNDLSERERAKARSAVSDPTFRDRLTHDGLARALAGITVSRRAVVLGGVVGLGGLAGVAIRNGLQGSPDELSEHPAARGVENQPTLGPAPSAAEGTIIAFEDPSCPSCARFERETFPRLKSELVDAGRLSFVFRGIPVVHQWAGPAVLALEATYHRRSEAFWALKNFYYREQSTIGTDSVRTATRQFLADQTDVDAAEVMADVDAEAFSDAVDTDLQASHAAGVRGTPTFFLFREGSFATSVVGPQSYDVFARSLEL